MSAPEPVQGRGASLSIWRDAPAFEGRRTAAVGAFECGSAEAGARLLTQTAERLAAEGFEAVVGPMDGDTWSRHRLVVESDGRAPFLLEPVHPPHHPSAFVQTGWPVISRYVSAEGLLPPALAASGATPGVRLRPLDPSRADAELAHIHAVSLAAFAGNFLYRPQPLDGFLQAYRPVIGLVDPELVVLAEDDAGDLRGFLFALSNWEDSESSRAVIVKTYASLDKGLGSLMAQRFYGLAAHKGYRRCIHALMREDNLSAIHSRNLGATPFRRYALWGTVL